MAANRKKKKKMKRGRKLLLFTVEILLLLVVVAGIALWKGTFGKIKFDRAMSDTEAGVNEDMVESTLLTMKGYTNIALFGLDNRKNGKWDSGNSDAIMIASINNDTKKVKLASVFRDTYLNVGRDKVSGEEVYRKINSAYARGGIKNAVRCLNENLDMDLRSYICVDWNALVEAIDALGGVRIRITEFERKKINFYIKETARGAGVKAKKVKKTGMVKLNGAQATSYARIRYGKGLDMMRSSRQRIVLQAMLNKAKKADFATLAKVCSSVFDDIQTSLQLTDFVYLAKYLPDYELAATYGFPREFTLTKIRGEDCVVPADLYENVKGLHEFLFEDPYKASQTVLDKNNTIVAVTGVTAENTDKVNFDKLSDVVGAKGTDELWEKTDPRTTESTEDKKSQ